MFPTTVGWIEKTMNVSDEVWIWVHWKYGMSEIIWKFYSIDTINCSYLDVPNYGRSNQRKNKFGLVLDDTVNKGTRKRHKTDKKAPILRCTFLHQYLIFIINRIHPVPFQKFSGLIKRLNYQCWRRNVHHRFFIFIFGLVPTQIFKSLVRALMF